MKRFILALASGLLAFSSHALDIVGALDRGQQVQLSKCETVPTDAPEALVLQKSFAAVLAEHASDQPVKLRVARCDFVVQVLAGEVVVHPAVAAWDEGERLFVLAHELGHIAHGDWRQFTSVFEQAIPADLPDDAVGQKMRELQPQLRGLMHGFEFNADRYAVELLTRLGRPALQDGQHAIARHPVAGNTPTHPGTAQRIARLTLNRD